MQCSLPRRSCDTTSRSTRSPSSLTTRSVTSCGTKMLLEEAPSGQSNFKPRTAIKSQALVDFMAEWQENQLPTPTERPEH
jgi:hypothetical protein